MYWHAASYGVVRARRLVSLWPAFRCCCALGGFAAVLGAVVVRRWVVSGLGLPLGLAAFCLAALFSVGLPLGHVRARPVLPLCLVSPSAGLPLRTVP